MLVVENPAQDVTRRNGSATPRKAPNRAEARMRDDQAAIRVEGYSVRAPHAAVQLRENTNLGNDAAA